MVYVLVNGTAGLRDTVWPHLSEENPLVAEEKVRDSMRSGEDPHTVPGRMTEKVTWEACR